MTELNQDGFDIPESSDVFLLLSSALNDLAAAKYVTATAKADREKDGAGQRDSSYTRRTASMSY